MARADEDSGFFRLDVPAAMGVASLSIARSLQAAKSALQEGEPADLAALPTTWRASLRPTSGIVALNDWYREHCLMSERMVRALERAGATLQTIPCVVEGIDVDDALPLCAVNVVGRVACLRPLHEDLSGFRLDVTRVGARCAFRPVEALSEIFVSAACADELRRASLRNLALEPVRRA